MFDWIDWMFLLLLVVACYRSYDKGRDYGINECIEILLSQNIISEEDLSRIKIPESE